MTPTERLILGLYAAVVAAWPIRYLVVGWVIGRCDSLDLGSPRVEADHPKVTAIIPAKDEESTLGECLASVCAQGYPGLEILVVDDRSTDGTAAIVEGFAARDPRVRLIRIHELPPGWTGKTHALHVATAQAAGDWLWYLDADTRHHPDCLSIVLKYALDQKTSMASLVPEMRCETYWEKVVQPLAGIVLMRSFPLFLVNREDKKLAFANGQYILMTRAAYAASGGHEAVRDRFVEDIYLAQRVKAAGLPIRVAFGTAISSTRMYTSLPTIVRGWSRIMYDAMGRRSWPLVAKVVEPIVFSQSAYVAGAVGLAGVAAGWPGPLWGWLLGLTAVNLLMQFAVLHRLYRISSPRTARYAAWYPLAGLVSDWILLRSIRMCGTGRVSWRGTSYGPSVAGTEDAGGGGADTRSP